MRHLDRGRAAAAVKEVIEYIAEKRKKTGKEHALDKHREKMKKTNKAHIKKMRKMLDGDSGAAPRRLD